jgi:pimeloyl-ACP methyl ester carboxylesterase
MPRNKQPKILLIHGAWHGAWYWEKLFAPRLRELGHRVETMDLPGHGQAGSKRIPWYSVRDYANAVEKVIASSDRPVVLVGHSMGGLVTQKIMERRLPQLAGAALVASVPPAGTRDAVLRIFAKHPLRLLRAALTFDLFQLVRTPAIAHSLFYTADFPRQAVAENWKLVQSESYRAFLDMLALDLPDPKRVDPRLPKWIVGGELDVIFPPAAVAATARAYGVSAHIYPAMAHSLPLDTGWERVADDLSAWVKSLPGFA